MSVAQGSWLESASYWSSSYLVSRDLDLISFTNPEDYEIIVSDFTIRGGIGKNGTTYTAGDTVSGTGKPLEVVFKTTSGTLTDTQTFTNPVSGISSSTGVYPNRKQCQDYTFTFAEGVKVAAKGQLIIKISSIGGSNAIILDAVHGSSGTNPYFSYSRGITKPGVPTIHGFSQEGNNMTISFTVGADGISNAATGIVFSYGSALSGTSIDNVSFSTELVIDGSANQKVSYNLTISQEMDDKLLYVKAQTLGSQEGFLRSDLITYVSTDNVLYYEPPQQPQFQIIDNNNDTFSIRLTSKNTKRETVSTYFTVISNGTFQPEVVPHSEIEGEQNNELIVSSHPFSPEDDSCSFTVEGHCHVPYGGNSNSVQVNQIMIYHILINILKAKEWKQEQILRVKKDNDYLDGLRMRILTKDKNGEMSWKETQKHR